MAREDVAFRYASLKLRPMIIGSKVIHVGSPFCAADTTSDRAILAYHVKLKRTRNKSALRSFFVTSPVRGFQMC
jgi:hypothetical protein